ncbi:hypothetical protein GCM10009555_033170 [Acrocarpospora macrocephala]|uniref:Uncharacterized protein n=1 Tax=Acrocarpospora macrocephala TaxID=150177 RepID=A0A5M3WJC3_9ACTN|nr:hypothetical protein Amac_000930 [Acrocarpospora macrocephala]
MLGDGGVGVGWERGAGAAPIAGPAITEFRISGIPLIGSLVFGLPLVGALVAGLSPIGTGLSFVGVLVSGFRRVRSAGWRK